MGNHENLGRGALWTKELWDRLDGTVHDEMQRTAVFRRFTPIVPQADVLTVPADAVISENGLLRVKETLVTEVIEIWVEFALTSEQIEGEERMATAVTLASRATNLLAQGEDLLIGRGDEVLKNHPLFADGKIHTRGGPGPGGLGIPDRLTDPERQIVQVPLKDGNGAKYGERTFGATAQGYALLQRGGHYGPYAMVLPTEAYADTFAPLEDTLIMPADRINPLVDGRLYGTGTLPEDPDLGILISLGGNSLDLVIAQDATVAFVQKDIGGLYRFRVFERFALRDKNPSSRVLLEFARKALAPNAKKA